MSLQVWHDKGSYLLKSVEHWPKLCRPCWLYERNVHMRNVKQQKKIKTRTTMHLMILKRGRLIPCHYPSGLDEFIRFVYIRFRFIKFNFDLNVLETLIFSKICKEGVVEILSWSISTSSILYLNVSVALFISSRTRCTNQFIDK